jgi:hypothetical protein
LLSNPPKLVEIEVEQGSSVQPLPHKCLMPAALVLADLLRRNFFLNEKGRDRLAFPIAEIPGHVDSLLLVD